MVGELAGAQFQLRFVRSLLAIVQTVIIAAGIRVAKSGHEGLWFELYVDESDDAVVDVRKKYQESDHEAKGDWKSSKRRV